jgi:hypothetical protein
MASLATCAMGGSKFSTIQTRIKQRNALRKNAERVNAQIIIPKKRKE